MQKTEASGGGGWRSGKEVAAIELHATRFHVQMRFIVQGSGRSEQVLAGVGAAHTRLLLFAPYPT
jgi:hypothetical protein